MIYVICINERYMDDYRDYINEPLRYKFNSMEEYIKTQIENPFIDEYDSTRFNELKVFAVTDKLIEGICDYVFENNKLVSYEKRKEIERKWEEKRQKTRMAEIKNKGGE